MYATALLVVILGFICQVRMEDCPHGWRAYGSKCFFFNGHRTSWYNAQNWCRHHGGILAEPTNEDENSVIAYTARIRAWIGLNDIRREGTFVGASERVSKYGKWNYNEPNNAHNKEDCAEINFPHAYNRLWNDLPCNHALPFVCEKRLHCPYKWQLRGNYCYFKSTYPADWYLAQRICRRMGGYLAEPKTAIQNHHVKNMQGVTWIGLNDRRREGKFVWDSNKAPMHWKNWNGREPNNAHNEDCTEIVHWKWNDLNCWWKRFFVCQRNPY